MGRCSKYQEPAAKARKSRARFGNVPDGEQTTRPGDSKSVAAGCDRFFAKRGMVRDALTFGRAD